MKANLFHAASLLIVSAAAAALVSCGGGGGGSGSGGGGGGGGPVALSANNMQPVTDEVLNTSLSFVSVGASTSSNTGEVPLSAQPKPRPRTRLLFGVLRQQLGALSARAAQSGSLVPLAATTGNCDMAPDGTTGTIVTDTETTSTTVTFSNCFSNGETINGTLALTNIATPAAGETTGHVSHNLTFVQAGLPTLTSSGDFDIDHTAGTVITDKLTGGPITVSLDSDVATISGFTITSSIDTSSGDRTDSVAGTIGTTAIGGTVTVATPTAFQTVATSTFPHAGQLIITGASNSAVRFTVLGDETAIGDQVTLEVDPEGDGTFQAPVGFSWATL
jgi:hypothetical protein